MPPKKRKGKKPLLGQSEVKLKKMKISKDSSDEIPTALESSSQTNAISQSSSYECSLLETIGNAYDEVLEASQNADIDIPDSISLMKFAECRASEIATIMQEVTSRRPKLSQQQLPHHMRRRAASHNPNRVPRRLRERALKEIQKAKKSKRPSRRHRRRPKNLLAEYNRRQRKFVWLETHIWFAKRFKMEELWGYKIPLHPNDKSVRSSFKATLHDVLIQDLSYFCCIELTGPQGILLSKLSLLTNAEVGLSFAAKMSLNGIREGHTFLYNPQSYPYGAVGPVSFLWKPILDISNNSEIFHATGKMESHVYRQLWIWCHPSIHNNVVKIMINLFDLKNIHAESEDSDSPSATISDAQKLSVDQKIEVTSGVDKKNSKVESDDMKMISSNNDITSETVKRVSENVKSASLKSYCFTSNITRMKTKLHFQKAPCYENGNLRMMLLKDNLVRHRLIGPMSQAVITDTLKIANVSYTEEKCVSSMRKKWWEDYYDETMNSLHCAKKDVWEQLRVVQTPDLFPPKTVIGLTVRDPRLDLPKVKSRVHIDTTVEEEQDETSMHGLFTPSISSSALWEMEVRNKVTATKQAESELNKIRSEFIVPGTSLDLGRDESRVPVIAIQQPGNNGYGSGWDIIAPLGWSMPFWIAFIYRRARASGLRELKSLSRELQQPMLPYNFPDTQSGAEFEKTEWQQKMAKHYRYPPDKRPSFQKLGIAVPYYTAWKILVSDWETTLEMKQNSVGTKQNLASENGNNDLEGNKDASIANHTLDFFVLRNKKHIKLLKEMCNLLTKIPNLNSNATKSVLQLYSEFTASILESVSDLKRALVLVEVKSFHKGVPCKYSGVYLLNDSDLDAVKSNQKYMGPTEPIHSVKKEKIVKKKNHTKLKIEPIKTKKSSAKIAKDTEQVVELEMPKIDTLYLKCSRKMIGYVDEGAYSFLNGFGHGIGHCTLLGFLEVLKMGLNSKVQPLVLVRAQNSLQYRVCRINVIGTIF